jgi:hypothetical protein
MNINYKLCVECGASFDYDRTGIGCPTYKHRGKKSKKRYDSKPYCPICNGRLIDTTDKQEQERAVEQKKLLNRLETEAPNNESVAGILSRAY